MTKNEISQRMSVRGYALAVDVHRGRLRRQDAINALVSETGISPGSAPDFIHNLRHMLNGEEYQRTLNQFTTRYFLERIRQDFGLAEFKNAISSLQKHVDYLDAIGKGRYPSLRELIRQGLDTVKDDLAGTASGRLEYDAPTAVDLAEPPADRVTLTVSRIIRDTALANTVKAQHNYECQICGHSIILADGSRYAEAHHIRPLGAPHDGPDVSHNILCLCPNHHAECDLGAIYLEVSKLRVAAGHRMAQEYFDYHNQSICGRVRGVPEIDTSVCD